MENGLLSLPLLFFGMLNAFVDVLSLLFETKVDQKLLEFLFSRGPLFFIVHLWLDLRCELLIIRWSRDLAIFVCEV